MVRLKKNLLKILPQIIAMLFLAGFAAFAAWQEPGSVPPDGNVSPPINVGPTAQTKVGDFTVNGVIKTLKDLIVGTVTIKSDGSVSPGLNSEKLQSLSAKEIAQSSGVAGTVTIRGYSGNGSCGGWGCTNCVCYDSTICSAQGEAFCSGTVSQNYSTKNITTFQPVCDPGYNLTSVSSVSEAVGGYCNYAPVTCTKNTYQCIKSPLVFPGCGNGVGEAGEVCDDGNQLNNIGACSADCSKSNYFSAYYSGILVNGYQMSGFWNYYGVDYGASGANQYCKEKGFSSSAKFNTFNTLQSPTVTFWNRSSWQTSNTLGGMVVSEIWCSP